MIFNTERELNVLMDDFQLQTTPKVELLFQLLTLSATPEQLEFIAKRLMAQPAIFQEFVFEAANTARSKTELNAKVLPMLEEGYQKFLVAILQSIVKSGVRLTAAGFNFLISDAAGQKAMAGSSVEIRELLSAQFKANGYCSLEEIEKRREEGVR